MAASNQLERILYILPAAAGEEGAPLGELARTLGVDTATILNDVEQVTSRAYYHPAASVDPFTIMIDGEGIQVSALSEFTRPVRLSAREAVALSLGLRALALDYAEPQRSSLVALANQLEHDLTVPEIELRPGLSSSEDAAESPTPEIDVELGVDDLRSVIASAIDEQRVCAITYFKQGESVPAERCIAPHKLVYARGRWYVAAEDVEQASPRLFRLDRMLRVVPTDKHFEPGAVSKLVEQIVAEQEPFVDDDADEEAVVRYSPRIARWIAEQEAAERDDDGSVRVRHQVADPRWLVRHVLQYGGEAVVESSPYREMVARAAQAMAMDVEIGPSPSLGDIATDC